MGDLPAVESILSNDPSTIANVPSTQTLLSLACLDGRYGKPQDRVEIVRLLLAHKLDMSTDAIASHIGLATTMACTPLPICCVLIARILSHHKD